MEKAAARAAWFSAFSWLVLLVDVFDEWQDDDDEDDDEEEERVDAGDVEDMDRVAGFLFDWFVLGVLGISWLLDVVVVLLLVVVTPFLSAFSRFCFRHLALRFLNQTFYLEGGRMRGKILELS